MTKHLYLVLILSSLAWMSSVYANDTFNSPAPIAIADGSEDIGYDDVTKNPSICSHKASGLPPLWQLLKKHQIGFTVQNNPYFPGNSSWLTVPDNCAIASNPWFVDEGYIYTFYDKNSPLYAFILVDNHRKQYLIAKVERTDWQTPISQGKISYVGTSTLPQAKLTLERYITKQ